MKTYTLFIWTDLITSTVLVGMKCTGNIDKLLGILFSIFIPIVLLFGILNLKFFGLGVKGFLIGFGLGEISTVVICLVYLAYYNWHKIGVKID